MDAITALGLSANVIQVINFSSTVVSHGYQIYKSADGMPDELIHIERLATDLSNCNARLTLSLSSLDSAQKSPAPSLLSNSNITLISGDRPPVRSSRFEDADDQALAELCRGCTDVAKTLLIKLEKVRLHPNSKKNEWKAAGKAFRAAWEQNEIESINSRLRHYREQLDTRILISLRDRFDRTAQQHGGRLDAIDGKASNILATLMQNRDEAAMDTSLLETRLKQLSHLIMAENEKTRSLLQVSHATTLGIAAPSQEDQMISQSRENTASPMPTLSLHEAVSSGTTQQVRKLLRNPLQSVDEIDEAGCSALHLACMNQRLDVAYHLLQRGAEVNVDDDTGSTPLHYAVKSGDTALVRLLLQRHASWDFPDNDRRKPFFYAKKDDFLIHWMRKFGHNVNAIDPVTGYTALIQAAKNGDVASVESMIEQDADRDIQCSSKKTALHYACDLGNLEIIEHLVDKGRGLELQDEKKCTPLMVATRKGNLSAVEILVSARANLETREADEKFTPLLASIYNKHTEIASYLISQKAALDAEDQHGYTPMTRAAQVGLLEIVRILINHGCDKDEINDKSHRTSISEAAANNFPEIVDYLAGLGANLGTCDGEANRPLQLAALSQSTECVRRLLNHRANPNITNIYGSTPLHEAAENGNAEVLKLLLEAGADVDFKIIPDNGGYTALQYSCMRGNANCVPVLLEHNANINAGNRDNWTPLMEACFHGHVEITEILMKAGANADLGDVDGRGPMQLAVGEGRHECIKLLEKYRESKH